MAPLPESTDVVVIGAGHNGLVCAAYLAKAGLRCLVLEGRATVGGNTNSEELTLPGFLHDSCSTAHTSRRCASISAARSRWRSRT